MDLSIPYELPYLHPAVVHLPIGLLLAAAGVSCGYALVGSRGWRNLLLGLVVAGLLAVWGARATGGDLADAVEGDPQVEELLGAHVAGAEWTLRLTIAATVILLVVTLARRRQTPTSPDPLAVRVTLLGIALASALLVAYTAHVGGLMVWGVPS